MSEEALQIAEKRKKKKRQRRKGKIYPSECRIPKIARRDKKAFLSDQCKETEENKWERLEISSRKLEIPKGTLRTKMASIKDRNCRDLTEAEADRKSVV